MRPGQMARAWLVDRDELVGIQKHPAELHEVCLGQEGEGCGLLGIVWIALEDELEGKPDLLFAVGSGRSESRREVLCLPQEKVVVEEGK